MENLIIAMEKLFFVFITFSSIKDSIDNNIVIMAQKINGFIAALNQNQNQSRP